MAEKQSTGRGGSIIRFSRPDAWRQSGAGRLRCVGTRPDGRAKVVLCRPRRALSAAEASAPHLSCRIGRQGRGQRGAESLSKGGSAGRRFGERSVVLCFQPGEQNSTALSCPKGEPRHLSSDGGMRGQPVV